MKVNVREFWSNFSQQNTKINEHLYSQPSFPLDMKKSTNLFMYNTDHTQKYAHNHCLFQI